MSAEIVNLHRARKARARADAAAQAAENRVKFGRSKGQKAEDEARAALARRQLDGHRRDDAEPDKG